MSDHPDVMSHLLDSLLDVRQSLGAMGVGLVALNVATLTILVDSKVIEREAIVARLQEFLDAMPEEHRNGLQGLVLRQASDVFRSDGPPPDPQGLFRVIDGGLNPQGRDQGSLQSDQ